MNSKIFRSTLSILLAVTMLLGLLPIFAPSADAAVGDGDWLPDGVYEIATMVDQNYLLDALDATSPDNYPLLGIKARDSSRDTQKWVVQRAVDNGEPQD